MKHLKKIVSVLLLLCMVAGGVVFAEPEKAKAWDTGDGTVSVYNLDNDYKDGLYRIWEKIVLFLKICGSRCGRNLRSP